MIKLTNINKFYSNNHERYQVLHNANLYVEKTDFVAIIGSSGSGKSTLLNIIGLLDNDFTGSYLYDNYEVSKKTEEDLAGIRNYKIGFVFQNFSLLSQYPIWYNVGLPLHYRNMSMNQIKDKSFHYLEKVGLVNLANRYPSEISGGQQQRVAIARALIVEPDIILADEPTGALDTINSKKVMDLFSQLHSEQETAIMIITHDQNIASLAKRQILINDGKLTEK